MLADDEANQVISGQAFALVHHIARVRLEHRRLTVIDATNLKRAARRPLLDLAARASVDTIAIVFENSLDVLLANNESRLGRVVPTEAVMEQAARLARIIPSLETEGYRSIYRLDQSSVTDAVVERRAETTEQPE